MPKSTSPVKT
jgi:hypothetical protein